MLRVRNGGVTIAEGIAMPDLSERPFAIIREQVAAALVLPEAPIGPAILLLAEKATLLAR